MRIHDTVTNFLTNNNKFCFIFDENNRKVEIPVIAYCGKHSSDLNYVYNLVYPKQMINRYMVPIIIFTDYYNATKEGGWSPDQKARIQK